MPFSGAFQAFDGQVSGSPKNKLKQPTTICMTYIIPPTHTDIPNASLVVHFILKTRIAFDIISTAAHLIRGNQFAAQSEESLSHLPRQTNYTHYRDTTFSMTSR